MKNLKLIIAFVIFLVLSGCAEKQYSYVKPNNPSDRICALHCLHGKSFCEKISAIKNERCLARYGKGASCYKRSKCVTSFNTCYSACGGVVREKI